jgi:ribonuclease VapC
MVVDTSALCAVLFGEPDAGVYAAALASPDRKFLSSVTMLEVSMVVEARLGEPGTRLLAELVTAAGLDVVAFDSGLAEVAFNAWRRYGKGRHPAGLNFGDCASYALAKVSRQSLLFKGADFPLTDVPSAPS